MELLRFRFQKFSVVFAALVLALATAGQTDQHEKLRWSSTNFKTLLTWDPAAGRSHNYSVQYAEHNGNWLDSSDCLVIPETECDLTHVLLPSNK
ncbi:hypothetical protein NHX12_004615 [Muraenolepis orangiensis]|uniref:Fibronectin type-III domain-containing protein n=1 Tax=Muraenolepis orangiensis TaxID=630683 RepID=A0A9Q0DVJ4_9TELE|nr:hypothetical protein NHX12_004615 [Muraenolepis orangiensis]